MTGSQYAPQRWIDIEAAKVQPSVIGIKDSVNAGQTKNIDTLIANDSLIRGVELIAANAALGDTVTVQVIDKDGVYAPANTVLGQPITNFNIVTDTQKQADYQSIAPFKILGGLYIRMSYTSTAVLGTVTVAANLLLAKVLI